MINHKEAFSLAQKDPNVSVSSEMGSKYFNSEINRELKKTLEYANIPVNLDKSENLSNQADL